MIRRADKQGQGATSILELVIEAILAVGVIYLAAGFMFGQIGDSSFHRKFFARDTALTIDQMLALPGTAELDYDATSEFDIALNVSDSSVKAHDIAEGGIPLSGPFATDPAWPVGQAWIEAEQFTIRKNESVNISG